MIVKTVDISTRFEIIENHYPDKEYQGVAISAFERDDGNAGLIFIDDKYEILKLIGQGGMSKVYLAMDKHLNKQWAVKEIRKNKGKI